MPHQDEQGMGKVVEENWGLSFTKLLVKEFFIREELPFSPIFCCNFSLQFFAPIFCYNFSFQFFATIFRSNFSLQFFATIFSLQFFATIFVDVRYPIDSNDHYPTKMLPAHRTSKKFVFGKIEVDIELDVILTLLLDFQ